MFPYPHQASHTMKTVNKQEFCFTSLRGGPSFDLVCTHRFNSFTAERIFGLTVDSFPIDPVTAGHI
jgi:hypothetical protein